MLIVYSFKISFCSSSQFITRNFFRPFKYLDFSSLTSLVLSSPCASKSISCLLKNSLSKSQGLFTTSSTYLIASSISARSPYFNSGVYPFLSRISASEVNATVKCVPISLPYGGYEYARDAKELRSYPP